MKNADTHMVREMELIQVLLCIWTLSRVVDFLAPTNSYHLKQDGTGYKNLLFRIGG